MGPTWTTQSERGLCGALMALRYGLATDEYDYMAVNYAEVSELKAVYNEPFLRSTVKLRST